MTQQDPAELFDDQIHIPGMESRFPGPVTPTETRLNRELNEAYAEIAALSAALQVKTEAADFWHGAYKRLAEKLTEAKRNDE